MGTAPSGSRSARTAATRTAQSTHRRFVCSFVRLLATPRALTKPHKRAQRSVRQAFSLLVLRWSHTDMSVTSSSHCMYDGISANWHMRQTRSYLCCFVVCGDCRAPQRRETQRTDWNCVLNECSAIDRFSCALCALLLSCSAAAGTTRCIASHIMLLTSAAQLFYRWRTAA